MIEQRTCQCPPIATATLAPNQDRRGDLVRFFTGRYTLSLDIIPNNHSSATVGAHLQGLRPVYAHWPARRASSSQDPMENATTPAATARTSRPWKRSNPAHVPVPATGLHRSHDTAPEGRRRRVMASGGGYCTAPVRPGCSIVVVDPSGRGPVG